MVGSNVVCSNVVELTVVVNGSLLLGVANKLSTLILAAERAYSYGFATSGLLITELVVVVVVVVENVVVVVEDVIDVLVIAGVLS